MLSRKKLTFLLFQGEKEANKSCLGIVCMTTFPAACCVQSLSGFIEKVINVSIMRQGNISVFSTVGVCWGGRWTVPGAVWQWLECGTKKQHMWLSVPPPTATQLQFMTMRHDIIEETKTTFEQMHLQSQFICNSKCIQIKRFCKYKWQIFACFAGEFCVCL